MALLIGSIGCLEIFLLEEHFEVILILAGAASHSPQGAGLPGTPQGFWTLLPLSGLSLFHTVVFFTGLTSDKDH